MNPLPLLILTSAITTAPNFQTPFASDMTISYESGGEIYLDGYPYDPKVFPAFLNPPQEIKRITQPPALTEPTPPSEITIDYAPNVPTTISNWTSIYRIYYNLQVEGMDKYDFSLNTIGWMEALNHLKADFQTYHASILRDVGVDLKIAHIHFVDEMLSPSNTDETTQHTKDIWNQLTLTRPHNIIIRLVPYPGGSAPGSSTCSTNVSVTKTDYILDNRYDVNRRMRTAAHEIGHQIFALNHTQCYFMPGSSVPIEECYGNNCGAGLPQVCPPMSDLSYLGYCSAPGCGSSIWPNLRLGPPHGPMTMIGRNNVLAYASQCLGSPITTISANAYLTDSDGDQIPDVFDNCPLVPNNDQLNSNMLGKGDACSGGCQITNKPKTSGWIFISLIFLLRRRNATNLHRRRLTPTNR